MFSIKAVKICSFHLILSLARKQLNMEQWKGYQGRNIGLYLSKELISGKLDGLKSIFDRKQSSFKIKFYILYDPGPLRALFSTVATAYSLLEAI